MAKQSTINCSDLSSMTTFPAYVTKMRQVTSNDFSVISQCKPEVCNALWGSGNSDISSIAVGSATVETTLVIVDAKPSRCIIGYIIENALAFALVLLLSILQHRLQAPVANPPSPSHRYLKIALRVVSRYQECATFFAFSTQLACLVILLEYRFNISVADIGYSTANIAEAVSLLTLLPLIYIAFQPSLLRDTQATGHKNDDHAQTLRFGLFVLCWLLHIYPFSSRMYHAFGPRSGELSFIESSQIKDLCFTDVNGSARSEVIAMRFFAVIGHFLVNLLTVTKMVKGLFKLPRFAQWIPTSIQKYGRKVPFGAVLFILLPALAISQIWTILRIQSIQKEISSSAGNQDADGKWSFGQIVAVTLFSPVPVEMLVGFLWD